jgi:hypothetical protein
MGLIYFCALSKATTFDATLYKMKKTYIEGLTLIFRNVTVRAVH